MSKYIKFVHIEPGNIEKPNYWDVINKKEGDSLGRIQYYATWKRFCFFPASGSVFSVECLEDIIAFIKEH